MERWLGAALDYIPQWLDFQMRAFERPGCIAAIAHRGKLAWERAWGYADLGRGEALTPRHRFRVASHSKSFTAAGVLRLRERGKLRLDDAVGQYVTGLERGVAATTIAQLLSHSAGLRRDMPDGGYFSDRRPYPSPAELADLLAAAPPAIEPNTRFKYSNVGYALVGRLVEAVAGAPYADWIGREVIAAAGLGETVPDMPLPKRVPMARGHSGRIMLGRRVVIPGDQATGAWGPVGGFVSTAADLALFYGQLAPAAKTRLLSPASRREMIRRQWRDPSPAAEAYYGLGVMCGRLHGWDWFGHSGGFQGFISRTASFPRQGLSISILTNSLDGLAWPWLDGVTHILQAFARHGAPSRRVAAWRGRWWSLWGATDLVPMGTKVFALGPGAWNPFLEASEIAVTGRDRGRIAEAGGGASYGEEAKLVRNASGRVMAVQLAANTLLPEHKLAAEMKARYGARGVKRGR